MITALCFQDLDNRYPFSHAVDLNRDIRKLGVTEDKQSFLDKFRQLISEIGYGHEQVKELICLWCMCSTCRNALGYVRMVRSAGMHAASEAVKFVPDLSAIASEPFEKAAREVLLAAPTPEGYVPEIGPDGEPLPPPPPPEGSQPGLSPEVRCCDSIPTSFPLSTLPQTLEAAKALDAVLANLTTSFSEGVDYFQVRVDAATCGVVTTCVVSFAAARVCISARAAFGGHQGSRACSSSRRSWSRCRCRGRQGSQEGQRGQPPAKLFPAAPRSHHQLRRELAGSKRPNGGKPEPCDTQFSCHTNNETCTPHRRKRSRVRKRSSRMTASPLALLTSLPSLSRCGRAAAFLMLSCAIT